MYKSRKGRNLVRATQLSMRYFPLVMGAPDDDSREGLGEEGSRLYPS